MSRIGKQPIPLPEGVALKIDGGLLQVSGKKGTLKLNVHQTMKVSFNDADKIALVEPKVDNGESNNFHGLTRSLISNMVEGVSNGFSKTLKLVGVGYRAALKGRDLNLTLGFSHPVVYTLPEGIEAKVEKQTTVIISGVDKELVGQVAANIRAYRKPEPYHGKGVRYSDERIITKAGKAGAKK